MEDTTELETALDNKTAEGEHIAQFFKFSHLPEALRHTSRQFATLALCVLNDHARNPERTVTLRKLLEAKDASVRSKLSGGKG